MSKYTPFPKSTTFVSSNPLHPLRPYYNPPSNNFTTEIQHQPTPGAGTHPDDPDYDDLIDSQAAARELLSYAGFKYLTSAVSNPFEVGKILLQVQYLPNEELESASLAQAKNINEDPNSGSKSPPRGGSSHRNALSSDEESDDDDGDFYGHKSSNQRGGSRRQHRSADNTPSNFARSLSPSAPEFHKQVPLDGTGYVVRSVYDDSTRPPHQIPVLENAGVWKAMTALFNQPTEGWRSLFKGQATNWIHEMIQLFLQPTLEGTLNDLFDLYDDTIPLVHLDHVGPNIATLIASHAIIGTLLSPLELVRTRLIVQSADPDKRKYRGPIDALRTIMAEEGGWRGLYANGNLLPTILYHTISPLLSNCTALIIDRAFGISPTDQPILYALAELCLNTIDLIITLPLETIRHRLQIQVRSRVPGKRLEAVVETRLAPYANMWDAADRITREEGRGGRVKNKKGSKGLRDNKKGVLNGWGLGGLYRGFGMHFTGNVITCLIHMFNGIDDDWEDF